MPLFRYMVQQILFWFFGNIFNKCGISRRFQYLREVINSRTADDKSKDYIVIRKLLRTGLLTSNGKKWRIRRKLIQPSVQMRNMETYVPIFNEHSLVLVDKLKEKADESWIDAQHMIVPCSLDIMFHSALGIQIKCQEGSREIQEMPQIAKELTEHMIRRMVQPWLWFDTIFYCTSAGRKYQSAENKVRNFVTKVILEGKKALETKPRSIKCSQQSENKNKFFLEILLEEHTKDENFTLDHIQDEVINFIFAGYDTTSTALSWALYLLGLHSDIQDRVYQELYSIFGDDKARNVTLEDVKNMAYLEQVIKETLRLYPSVPFIGRENKESIKIGRYIIPPGTHIVILINMLHKNPEVFQNPEKFNPERFSPENTLERDAFCYLPFSSGVRACLGYGYAITEMKIVLAHIIRNFKVTTVDPLDRISVMMSVTLRCLDPLRLRFTSRT
ncbi:cytochrome P450 4C1-like isoform X2 [Stegodyphus dumicola]|uniref:cytochrome P450 4C1-like isoform X2 n=1 Tax=Stegodyphus dumicola TaxID=202533 RepID=UPI0015B159BF|nr:cytochrome P450 4C1-like isoform X2 [Stegodyphus dumicola]